VGFAVFTEPVSATELSQRFANILGTLCPKRLSHDHDPIFRSIEWKRLMAVLEIEEVWTVPFVPLSHCYVERLIGTIRRELLDRTFFWNTRDLERKLMAYQQNYNESRVHAGIEGRTPAGRVSERRLIASPEKLKWKSFCNGLFSVPLAA
jgi:putative transposase